MITSAKPSGDGYRVTYDDGRVLSVPNAPDNRHFGRLQAWLLQDGNILDPEFTLAESKRQQTAAINAACEAEIVAGFGSSVLGSPHTYKSKLEDQLNLMGAAMGGVDMPFKCADGAGVWAYRAHTGAQLQQVFADGSAIKLDLLQKAAALKQQVADAETEADIETVEWWA